MHPAGLSLSRGHRVKPCSLMLIERLWELDGCRMPTSAADLMPAASQTNVVLDPLLFLLREIKSLSGGLFLEASDIPKKWLRSKWFLPQFIVLIRSGKEQLSVGLISLPVTKTSAPWKQQERIYLVMHSTCQRSVRARGIITHPAQESTYILKRGAPFPQEKAFLQ